MSFRTPYRSRFPFGSALLLAALAGTPFSVPFAQSLGSGGAANAGPAPVVSPFFPTPGPGGSGGQYIPPSDIGGPKNDSNNKSGSPTEGTGARAPVASAPRGTRPVGSSGPSRGGSSSGPTTIRNTGIDNWVHWWETNKFDFISLRRTSDTPITGQGRVTETAIERTARVAATQALVRADVLPVLRALTGATDAAVRASSVVALAKLQDVEGADFAKELLQDRNFDVRRASMLAMGVLSAGRSSYVLMNIADDSSLARKLLNTTSISDEDRGVALLASALRGHRAPEALVADLLQDTEDLPNEVLASACDAAGLIGAVGSIAELSAVALDDNRPEFVRASATTALGRLGDPGSVPALLKILDTALEPHRAATVALGLAAHSSQKHVIDRLTSLMESTDGPTRHFAAISLGRLGGETARFALRRAFEDPRSDMRPWLALGLGLCERREPLGQLPELLIRRFDQEANAETAGAYLIALGLCGHNGSRRPSTTLPWESILATLTEQLNGKSTQIAAHAALALGLSGHPDATGSLLAALDSTNSPDVQRQIALALGVLGNSTAIPKLLELMRGTNNPFVASFAAIGIAFLGDADAVGPLMRMIDKSGPRGVTTTYAVAAVGQLLDTERRPALSRLASGDNYLARTSSVQHLLALGF